MSTKPHVLSVTDARKGIAALAKHDPVLAKLIDRADMGSSIMIQTPHGREKKPGVKLTKKFFAEREAYALKVVEYAAERLATKGYVIADKDKPSLAKGLLTGFFFEDTIAGMIRQPHFNEKLQASTRARK